MLLGGYPSVSTTSSYTLRARSDILLSLLLFSLFSLLSLLSFSSPPLLPSSSLCPVILTKLQYLWMFWSWSKTCSYPQSLLFYSAPFFLSFIFFYFLLFSFIFFYFILFYFILFYFIFFYFLLFYFILFFDLTSQKCSCERWGRQTIMEPWDLRQSPGGREKVFLLTLHAFFFSYSLSIFYSFIHFLIYLFIYLYVLTFLLQPLSGDASRILNG